MRFLRNHWLLVIIYVTCVTSACIYGYQHHRYSGVESWPHVPATDVSEEISSGTIRSDSYTGSDQTSTSIIIVKYGYVVDGVQYEGSTASPDGGSLPPNFDFEIVDESSALSDDGSIRVNTKPRNWKAFYDPANPSVAVLDPTPFRGFGYLWVAGFTGIIVACHIFFTFKNYEPNKSKHPTVNRSEAKTILEMKS